MDSLSVHIAVLTIANDIASADRATAQAIVERARAAGHEVVDEDTVKDSEDAIRDQLVRWIAEPDIDVVMVAASIDSDAASAALAPLIMQTLPGFTDLFRWLTFQEIGASAMLSAAEAAQCESTFVFVLPAHEAAVRAAMDKLILPQLDVDTKPKNLVTQMPRLKDAAKQRAETEPSSSMTTPAAAHHAVPVPIAAEKTSGGSGLPPKLPARTRQATANIIARRSADPPTKEIDLARLEKQIELSNVNDAQTKQIQVSAHDAKTKVVDMSAHQAKTRVVDSSRVLSRVPPGADDGAFEDDDSLTFSEPPAAMAKRIPSLSGKGPSVKTPPFARSTPGDRHTAPTPPAATPQLRPPSTRHTTTSAPPVTSQLRPPADRHTAVTPPAATPVPRPPATPVPPAPIARTRQPTPPPPPVVKRPATQPPPVAARRPPTEPPPVPGDKKRPAPNAAELWSRSIASPTPREDDERSDRVARPAETPAAAASAPATASVSAPEPAPASEAGPASASDESDADAPPPISAVLAAPPPRVRKPTPPPLPQVDPLAAVTSRPIDGGELPQGDFVYPVRRSGGALLLKLLAGAAIAGLGFFAFVKLYPSSDRTTQTAAVTTPAEPAAVPVEPPPPTESPTNGANGNGANGNGANGSSDSAEDEPAIEMEAPEPRATHATASTSHSRPTGQSSGSHASTHATSTSSKPAGTESTPGNDGHADSKPVAGGSDGAADAKPATDPGCDEVSCVLSKYDRPCCERYKPTETFTPKNVVPDELDRSMVKAGVEKVKPRIVACGEKHQGKGTVKLAVSVDASGKVKSASVTETPDPALGECVKAALLNATFGKSVNGGEFAYPFVF